MSEDILRVPETISFPDEEEKILLLWKELKVFKSCLKQSKGKPRYSFYDGPPFATGLPHYGHILAGTIKDVVTRYAHQQGYHVERRFGWDCHGLPVEFEIDKTLNIKGPDDVMEMGIDKYNAECRKIVTRYALEWETIIGRMGRWIDFENDYKTLYPWFMESVWWVFKQLFSKGLVYQGIKVMPFSTACNTPLSNFESGQNYKDVVDPAVVVSFPIVGQDAAVLAWTTTPWTLPSNLALCVNAKLTYVKIHELTSNKKYILVEALLPSIFKKAEDYKILEKFPGSKLKGLKYEPLFPYFKNIVNSNAYTVLTDDYVSAESGTGIVHQAPYFGEDDYRVCLAAGIITRDQEPICPVNASGAFVLPVTDFEGQYVKDADKNIIAHLKNSGRLVQSGQVKHSYPFCWRSDTPLIYKAVPSWFIRVEHMTEALLKSSASTYWVPDFVKEKRFGNWLKDARDWAISRNRYWGTPIPLWISEDGKEVVCVGSIAELETLTGSKITDLHRESIDHLVIPSKRPGCKPLRRIPEVFDCWFESGSMPYAQQHYPFENRKEFDECFPAEFIAEGIDQTRGWFYTLLVISTALFGKPPFKNLIANGLVLASDGQKMSKRKKNYPDPLDIVHKYGADALRLYLINSPVVRAENLRFKETGVRDVIKDIFLPWYNAFRFLMQNIEGYIQEHKEKYVYDEHELLKNCSDNIMDRWILSFTQSLLDYVRKEMELYHLYTVVPRLTKFFDHLTNWYVRMNRKRLKGEFGKVDCKHALNTLFNVLYNIVKLMSPFVPFLSEFMYQYLKRLTSQSSVESVHYLMLPKPNRALIDLNIERSINAMQNVIELGRVVRDRKTIPIKYPLPEIIVIHQSKQYIEDVELLKDYILSELNVRKLTETTDREKYGVDVRAEPDHKVLGARLKDSFKAVTADIKSLTYNQINAALKNGYFDIQGHRISPSEIRLICQIDISKNPNMLKKFEAHSDNDVLILLNITPDDSMQDEGIAREIVNRIQKLRKKAHLVPTDEICVYYEATGELSRISESHKEFITSAIKADYIPISSKIIGKIITEEKQKFKDSELKLVLTTSVANSEEPCVPWANVIVKGIIPRYGAKSTRGTVLLQIGDEVLSFSQFKDAIDTIFGTYGINYKIFYQNDRVENDTDILKLKGKTVIVMSENEELGETSVSQEPFVKFKNFENNGLTGTIILENPQEIIINNEDNIRQLVVKWISTQLKK